MSSYTTDNIPSAKIVSRLRQLAHAATLGSNGHSEFYMSIPARPEHDADLVLSEAAMRIERLDRTIFKKDCLLKDAKDTLLWLRDEIATELLARGKEVYDPFSDNRYILLQERLASIQTTIDGITKGDNNGT